MFIVAGLLTAIYSIFTIRRSGGQIKGIVLAYIASATTAVLISLLVLFPILHIIIERNNDRRWAGLNQIEELGRAMGEYEKAHGGYFPDANRWCDELLKECKWLNRDYFVHPLRKHDICSFAFNRALSGLSIGKIDPNTVLLFEAEGSWNLNGGQEMLKQRKNLDSYVLLVSGRAYRYSFTDMGIEQYNTNSHEVYIGPFIWEPNFPSKSSNIK